MRHQKYSIVCIISIILIFITLPAFAQAIIYVDANVTNDNNDGSSWTKAKKYLQSALVIASSGDEIWVAEGTYYPDEGTGQINNIRSSTFQLKNGVAIYGGYPNGGGTRDVDANETVLSGDLDQSGDKNDNDAYNVVKGVTGGNIDGFTISGGNANGTSGDEKSGGGMYNESSSPMVNNCTFSNNYATENGGGMYNYPNSDPTVTNCTFSFNSAGEDGGGMYNTRNSTVTNCTFLNNSAVQEGGGMRNYHTSDNTTVNNCIFSNNSAEDGAGIHNTNSSPNITDCNFDNNTADDEGGGIFNAENSNPTITNCIFTSNSAIEEGGGIMNSNSDPSVTKSTFSNNSTEDCGGGMHNASSDPTVTNCTFYNNSAINDGGGICNKSSASPIITNCTFSNNSANRNGDGIANLYSSNLTVKNSILWGSNDQIYNDNSTLTVTYSDVQQSSGTCPGTGNINSDPKFVSSSDFHLHDISPCIGVGTSDGAPTDDIEGNQRPNPPGSNPDMGAYENTLSIPVPVELSIFTAISDGEIIILEWTTQSETENFGFNIYRSLDEKGEYIRINTNIINGAGTSSLQHNYNFVDYNVKLGNTYYYKIAEIDFSGNMKLHGPVSATVGTLPNEYVLLQNYPNPFNPTTLISFDLPEKSNIKLTIYNIAGKEIEIIKIGEYEVGHYEILFNAKNLTAGLYFYRLESNNFVDVKKMTVLK